MASTATSVAPNLNLTTYGSDRQRCAKSCHLVQLMLTESYILPAYNFAEGNTTKAAKQASLGLTR